MTVDEFVNTRVLPEFRPVVTAVRELMREAAPKAEEMISYGIPAYKVKRIIAVIRPYQKRYYLRLLARRGIRRQVRLAHGTWKSVEKRETEKAGRCKQGSAALLYQASAGTGLERSIIRRVQ